jgi:CubicO group peptidase (beta-lactamase class C family)
MRHSLSGLLAFALGSLVACGGAEHAASPRVPPAPMIPPIAGPSVPEQAEPSAGTSQDTTATQLAADSPLTTPSGATFTGPKGWTVTTKDGVVLLDDPNREVSVTFVERKEPDGQAAIAAAWKQVKPDFARKVRLTATPPGRRGWDAAADVDYETTTEETRGVWANARRKGDTWYVTLFDGTNPGWGRRWPGANIAFQSFKAKGVEDESFRGKKAHVLDDARLKAFESFVEEAQKATKIPGLAVVIIQGGKVVLEKGYGVRELGKKEPVTPNTLFRIASMSKPLTSLMMASLVDEGKFGWDTPATQIYPAFAVGDAELTKRMTMKTILCACTGIPYDNVGTVFEWAGVTPETALSRLKDVKPTTGFGETFQYSNAMIAAGGYIAAHASDPKKPMALAYDEAMKAKVFGPLGMESTTFDAQAAKRAEHASPHDRSPRFEMVSSSHFSDWIAPLNPGGGAWSNVRDLSRYLLMELGKGKTPEGKQVVSDGNLLKRREPQGRSGDKTSYGLALGVESYRDVQVFGHGGGLAGYTSYMFFLPEHGVAAVMLTNVGFPNPFVQGAFRRKLFELLFDGRDEAREDLAFALKTGQEDVLKETSKIDFEPDRAWLTHLAGTYEHPLYGKMTLRIDGNRGILDAGEWKGPVGRKTEEDGSVKLVLTTPPWLGWPEFVPKEANGKVTLHLQDGQRKVVFEPVK